MTCVGEGFILSVKTDLSHFYLLRESDIAVNTGLLG